MVGPAMLALLRERFGQGLQGLASLLQLPAPPSASETRSSICIACHGDQALQAAVQQLQKELQDLRASAAREQSEVAILGSTRCLLGPGGELRCVLTAGQHVTLAVSGFGADSEAASEAALRRLFGRHGEVTAVRMLVIGETHTARVTMANAAQAAAAQAALHNKALPDGGGRLSVAGYAPPSAHKLFRPANVLHLSWSRGRPDGTAYVEFADGAQPVAAAVQEAENQPELPPGLVPYADTHGGLRGLVCLQDGVWVKAQASQTSRRVLQLTVCDGDRSDQRSPPMQLFRKPERLRQLLSDRFSAVSKLTIMQEADPDLQRDLDPVMLGLRLRSLLQEYGSIESLDVMPYNTTKQIGSAFASFTSAQECTAARAALDGSTATPWLGRQPLRAHSDLVCRLRLDGRCHAALRGRLAFEVDKLRAVCPEVKVTIIAGGATQQSEDSAGPKTQSHGTGGATIKLQGSDVGQVVQAKRALEAATSGRLVNLSEQTAGSGSEGGSSGERLPQDAMLFVLSAPGKALVKQIEAAFSGASAAEDNNGGARDCVHIRWDRTLGQLRIYGSNDATVDAAEQRLRRALQERQAGFAPLQRTDSLSQTQLAKLQGAGGQTWLDSLAERHSLASARLAFKPRGVTWVGEAAAVEAAAKELQALLSVPLPRGARRRNRRRGAAFQRRNGQEAVVQDQPDVEEEEEEEDGEKEEACCPVCFCPPEGPHKLLLCGHVYCQSCVQQLLVAAASSNQLPARCCAEGCDSGVSLRDCLVLLGPEQMERVHRSAFNAHIGSHPEAFGCCLTPDCGQVYAKQGAAAAGGGGARGGAAAAGPRFACDCCLMSWCTSCQVPWHLGTSCNEYQETRRDQEFEAWKQQNTKPCPGCRVPIEKNSGCNHMTCANCKAHFCWKCGEAFTTRESTYDHLRQRHGGYFG